LAGLAAVPVAARADDERSTSSPQVGYMTPSGLRYFDFAVGNGPSPKWGDLIEVDYASYTISPAGDALVMADNTFKSDRSLLLHHGNGETVLGMEEALHTMRLGGRRRVIVPPELAYASPGLYPMPLTDRLRSKFLRALNETGGTVVFDLELLNIMDYPDEHGYYSDPTPSPEEIDELVRKAREEYLSQKG
jgi:hypothetical protein